MVIGDPKSLIIFGGTGSLGSSICRAVKDSERFRRVAVFSRDWHKQEKLRRELDNNPKFRWFLGDITDTERVRTALRGVDWVIHAAALKSIELGDYNPNELIRVNVTGTQSVLQAALDSKVERFLFVSSDKAVSPSSSYGSSKNIGERLTIAYNNYAGSGLPDFACVRYGNVLGSNGSVIPLWKEQVAQGKPVTITDPYMTRFWITMPQAVEFVLNALEFMRGGFTYVPQLKSCTVEDLLIAMNISRMEQISVRAGEKHDETMISELEVQRTINQGWAYSIFPEQHWWEGGMSITGTPVTFDRYASDKATRLTILELQEMLKHA